MDLAALYSAYADAVYGYLAFKLQDRQLVEDLVQETFLAAQEGLDRLETVHSPKAWLLAIAHNKMVGFLRRRPPDLPLIWEGAAVGDSSALFVEEALKQLADLERTIVYGLYVEGFTYRELAEMLSLPEGTVKSKAHNARRHLYRWLQEGER